MLAVAVTADVKHLNNRRSNSNSINRGNKRFQGRRPIQAPATSEQPPLVDEEEQQQQQQQQGYEYPPPNNMYLPTVSLIDP